MSILGFRPKQRDAPHRCPKHDVRYALRRDVNQGVLVEACPLCDIEARGGAQEDVEALRLRLVETAKEPPL